MGHKKKKKKLCEFCKKNKAAGWFHGKRICNFCWWKVKRGIII